MKSKWNFSWVACLCLVVTIGLAPGCDTGKSESEGAGTAEHDHDHDHDDHGHDHEGDHDHDHEGEHAHDHAEEIGPHGGHIATFEDDKGVFEWAHTDSANMVRVFLLAADKETLAPAAVTSAKMIAKSGDQTKEFELTAADEADGKAATFEREDPALISALQLGVELHMETADGPMHAVIKPHVH